MNKDTYHQRMEEILRLHADQGAGASLPACAALAEDDLAEAQRAKLAVLEAQILTDDPERREEARVALRAAIDGARALFVVGHPDRDEVERVDRWAFGPRGALNAEAAAARWAGIVEGARLNNEGEAAEAKALLEPLLEAPELEIRAHARLGALFVALNLGDPEGALREAQRAADLAEGLADGHWLRRQIEKTTLPRVVVVRAGAFPDALRDRLTAAIEVVNEGGPEAMAAWRGAVEAVEAEGDPEQITEARRMDRLLTGYAAPLGLMMAFERMKAAQASGDLKATLDATEAAYFMAHDAGAERAAAALEDTLLQAGRL